MAPRRFDHLPLSAWRWLALPAWCVYRPLVALRNRAYDLGWRPVLRLPVPVISVGNLAVGGTGKTPVVAWIADHLRERGHHPAVLMRGYRGDATGNDEARLLDLPVICNPDRIAAGQRAVSEGASCLVLDDGFQHRRVHRDLDVVLIDATRPWAGGAVLPLGLLREGFGALQRAHVIVVSRSDQVESQALAAITTQLAAYGKPVLLARHAPATLQPLSGGESVPPTSLAGRAVLLASGLGNPLGFERTANDLGWNVIAHRRFPDHHHYTASEAAALASEAARLGASLVVTSKDAVKLRHLPNPSGWVLNVELAFAGNGAAELGALLDQVSGSRR